MKMFLLFVLWFRTNDIDKKEGNKSEVKIAGIFMQF